MSPDEDDLRITLQEDADRISAKGNFATAAIRLERRRAHRRVVAGVAAAALVVVTTPLLWASQQTDVSLIPATPTSTTPPPATTTTTAATSPPPTTAPPSRPPANRATTAAGIPTYSSDAGTGRKVSIGFDLAKGIPRAAYASRGVFHDGDRTVRLPVSTGIQYVARLEGGGVLVYAPAEGRAEPLIIVDAAGGVVARIADVQDVAVSKDGSRIATADGAGRLHLRDVRGEQLGSFDTRDRNVTVSGIFGGDVYYTATRETGAVVVTRVWRVATGASDGVTAGRVKDVVEGTSLALVWPNQDFDPENTCYSILDLRTGRTRYVSCGEFAPTQFTEDGSMVVGPNVADGPGSSRWKIASTKDGSILLNVVARSGNWAPSPRAVGQDGLAVELLQGERATRQAIVSCAVSSRSCTVDTDPLAVSAKEADSLQWPIALSAN